MSESDPPSPWRIAAGPHRLSHGMVEGAAWLFTLKRDDQERSLVVVVSRQALKPDAPRGASR